MAAGDEKRLTARHVVRRIRHWTRPGHTPLASLEAATPESLRKLETKGFATAENLWAAVEAPDPRPGLGKLAKETGVSEDELVDLLVEAAARDATLARLADALVPAALLAVLALVVLRAGAVLGLPLGSAGPAPLTGAQVVAKADLPAFRRVAAEDVTVEEKPRTFGAAQDPDQVVGRYTLAPVGKGEPVRPAALSARIGAGSDGRILAVPLARGAWRVSPAPGTRAQLLLSPGPAGAAAGLKAVRTDAIVLRIDRDGELRTATLALTPTALDSVGPLLGVSDAYLVQTEQ